MGKKGSGKAPRRAHLPSRAKRLDEPPVPHIVGVGASAGGLEALGQLLGRIPDSSGLAFVVVQHLDFRHARACCPSCSSGPPG